MALWHSCLADATEPLARRRDRYLRNVARLLKLAARGPVQEALPDEPSARLLRALETNTQLRSGDAAAA